MFKRAAARRASVDDDSISITSTQSSEHSDDHAFEVKRVLAEKTVKGRKLYLLLWEGYPEYKSTWEPKVNICDDNILNVWKERKMREARGIDTAFDVAKYEAEKEKREEEKKDRHRRRKAKRKRRGISVSDSDPEDDGDSGVEAVESKLMVEDDMVMKKKKKADSSPKKSNKPVRILVTGGNVERLNDSSPEPEKSRPETSRNSGTKKLSRPASTSVIDPSQPKGKENTVQTNTPKPGQTRKAPSAPVAAPPSNLDNQRRRKSQPQSPDSDSDEPLAKRRPTEQVTRRASTTSAKQDSRPGSVSSNATVDVPPRNLLAIRKGKGALRGGSSMQAKNVFITRDPPKKRPGIIQTSRDPSKDQKHFSNMHIIYKAQQAARDLADAAPDIRALPGGLFDPSKPNQYQPLNPTLIRKTSSGAVLREGNIDDLFSPEDGPSEQASNVSGSLPSHEYWETTRELEHATCYFWFNNGGICANRQNCSFLHRVVKGVPVSPRPSNLVDKFQPMTCHFWNLNGSCEKGDNCKFLHYHDEGIPIAPNPLAREGGRDQRQPSGQETIPQSDKPWNDSPAPQLPLENQNESQPPGHSFVQKDPSTGKIQATCWFLKNQGACSRGDSCDFLHIIDASIPVAESPPGYVPRSYGPKNPPDEEMLPQIDDYQPIVSSPQHIENYASKGHEKEPRRAADAIATSGSSTMPQKSVSFADVRTMPDPPKTRRPPWNPCDPFNAICYYWNERGSCSKGKDCYYTHSSDISLPIAPSPKERESTTCRHWAEGTCHHVPCEYPHRFMDDYLASIRGTEWESVVQEVQRRHLEQTTQAGVPPTRSGPKSVSFAEDHSLPAFKEPENARPSASKRPRWQPNDPFHAVCYKWYRDNNCPFGLGCRYKHEDSPRLPLSPFVTCKHWARGHCPRSARECNFVHEDQPDEDMPDGPLTTSANSVALGSSSPSLERIPTGPRSKSFKFSSDDICRFWIEGSCRFGRNCNFKHEHAPGEERSLELQEEKTGQSSPSILPPFSSAHSHSGNTAIATPEKYSQSRSIEDWPPESIEGKTFVAKITSPKSHQMSLEVLSGDKVRVVKYVSGILFQGTNLRTGLGGQISKSILSTLSTETDEPNRRYVPNEAQYAGFQDTNQARPTFVPPTSSTHNPSGGLDFAMDLDSEVVPITKVTKAKMSVEEYRRKKAVKSLGNRAKNVVFGSDEQAAIIFDVGDFGQEAQKPWARLLSSLSDIRFDQACVAQNFEAHRSDLQRQTFWEGGLVPADPGDAEASKAVDTLVENLRLKASGLIATFPDFFILTYPAKAEEWKFLEQAASYPKEIRLRYLVSKSISTIKPALEGPAEVTRESKSISYRKDLVRTIHGLSVEQLIPYVERDQKKNLYNFYLLFPSSANDTATFITSWLRNSRPESRIFSSQTEGSWAYFIRNFTLGVVLVHESFASEICSLPMLSDLIYKRSTINFWYISDSSSQYPLYPSDYELDDSNLGKLNVTRLFPHGATFLLTPSFIVAEPERTYALLVWFFGRGTTKGKIDQSNPGTWKIVCCYGFIDYLLDVANAKSLERDRFYEANKDKLSKDAEATQKGLGFENCTTRYKIHAFMVDVETRRFDMASDNSIDYYTGISDEIESPIIYADRDINPDDEKSLVEWYAGWSAGRLDRFRKFTVVGTSSASALRASRLKSFPKEQAGAKTFTAFSFPKPNASSGSKLTSQSVAKQKALAVAAKFKNLHVNPNIEAFKNNAILSPSAGSPQSPIGGGMLSQTSPTRSVNSDMSMDMDISPAHAKPSSIIRPEDQRSPALDHTREELDAQIAELIQDSTRQQSITDLIRSSAPNNNPRDLPRLTTTHLNSLPQPATATSAEQQTSPYFSATSPFQLDGAADNQPISSGTDSSKTSRSGIAVAENGQRFVPRSLRPSGTVRPEINIKPGYIPAEDKDVYRNRRVIDGVPQYEVGGSSSSNSTAASPAAMSPPVVSGSVFDSDEEGEVVEEEQWKEVRFEATTAWYRALLADRGGWGHVCVEGWERAWEVLGVKK